MNKIIPKLYSHLSPIIASTLSILKDKSTLCDVNRVLFNRSILVLSDAIDRKFSKLEVRDIENLLLKQNESHVELLQKHLDDAVITVLIPGLVLAFVELSTDTQGVSSDLNNLHIAFIPRVIDTVLKPTLSVSTSLVSYDEFDFLDTFSLIINRRLNKVERLLTIDALLKHHVSFKNAIDVAMIACLDDYKKRLLLKFL
jgi:hypothetical protein